MDIRVRAHDFLRSRFVRVFIIGGVGVLVQTIVFEIIGIYLRLVPPSTAVLIGAEVAILTNFYLNNRFSFHDRRHDVSFISRLMRFHLVVSGSIILQWLFVFIAEHQTNDLLILHAAYAAGIILGFAWNYTFYHLFVWRNTPPAVYSSTMQCTLCNHSTAEMFLDLGLQPLANKYPTKDQFANEDFFPLAIYFCTTCKNVQLGTIVSRERMFVDYYYLSSVNPGLVRHFEEFAKQMRGAKFVVDIGSNDGILLKPLKKLGVKAIGVEPSVNVSKIANDAGLETITSFFDAPTVAKIVAEHGKSDMVVTSSVFTHVENPHQIIEDVKNLMTDDGAFIIEVEHIGAFVANTQFERFYFDRPYYYSATSLRDLFALHDMYIADVEHIAPHGGSIRVTTYKNGHNAPKTKRFLALLKEEEKTLTLATMKEFKNRSGAYVRAFREKLEEYKKAGVKVAGYSAPARVSTICNYGNIGSDLIEFLVDDSPLKQNRHSPGTHIPIVPKEYLEQHKADLLVVFAYEYLDDIRKKTEGHGYRYLIPIPPREVK